MTQIVLEYQTVGASTHHTTTTVEMIPLAGETVEQTARRWVSSFNHSRTAKTPEIKFLKASPSAGNIVCEGNYCRCK